MKMNKRILALFFGTLMLAVTFTACNRTTVTGSKVTLANYNLVTTGMTKAQVGNIMGPPTSAETKDMLIFKKTTFRYEEGTRFAQITFKNDECDGKDSNLAAQ